MHDFIFNVLSLIVGSIVTWLFTRNKQDAEVTRLNLENINIAVGIWRDTAQELSVKVEKLTMEVEMLRRENISLKAKLDKTILTIEQKSN